MVTDLFLAVDKDSNVDDFKHIFPSGDVVMK